MPEGFSLKETATLAEISERVIRHELARGIAGARVRRVGKANRLRFNANEVFYYYLLRALPVALSRIDRRDLFRVVATSHNREGRWIASRNRLRLHGEIDLEIDLARPRKALRSRIKIFENGLRRVESRLDVLSGEPVFKGTRVPVRHIGSLAIKGIPITEIRDDWPWLTEDDIRFARLFVEMRPGPGRPRKPIELRRSE